MKEITKEQFFKIIGLLDVNPSHQNPEFTEWKLKNGQVIGKSLPGWRNYYTNGKLTTPQYWLDYE
jgi:hypothetical protein